MPMTESFENRLYPVIEKIAEHYGTPFHIYDETGIRETAKHLIRCFSKIDSFREYFAVKALPNPHILSIMKDLGFGFDCSSVPELLLARKVGARGNDIMFTSNNTSREEFEVAAENGGCILNLDDITLIDKVPDMPELISFRYNPGERRTGNDIIGNPVEAKYGVSHDQILEAYKSAIQRGAIRFGLHTMLASNELNYRYMVQTAQMLLELCEWIKGELGIGFEFINIGGGLGIPYTPEADPLDLDAMGKEITDIFVRFREKNGYAPRLFLESGRFMTGPHGVLVATAINKKQIYRKYIGLDACMSSLMRPAIYGAYHHITIPGKEDLPHDDIVDVVGALCENNDKFAIQRPLPEIAENDRIVIHDTGAHGHSMGFNYNGRLRPQELLMDTEQKIRRIRRAETVEDYFATLKFESDELDPVVSGNGE